MTDADHTPVSRRTRGLPTGYQTGHHHTRPDALVARSFALVTALAGQALPASAALLGALLLPAGLMLLAAAPVRAQVTVSVRVGPPPLPYYVQPTLIGDGYLWLPGYWAWSAQDFDYYWVPGTWALAPQVGWLWTPGWWGFDQDAYHWHAGSWGEQVGYYGGIDYGYGYSGLGYQGGRWEGPHFHYNTSVNNLSSGITRYSYRSSSFSNHNVNRASYNGGPGGVIARPTPVQVQQQAARRQAPTDRQQQHERQALTTPAQRHSVNHGAPPVAATPRPSEFASPAAARSRPPPPARPKDEAPARPHRGQQGDGH
ncbi:MAG: hypothetical protein RL375_3831 [Pseudomonadota bacterium]